MTLEATSANTAPLTEENTALTEATEQGAASATSSPAAVAAQSARLQQAVAVLNRLSGAVRSQVLGRDDVIELAIIALIADGHVLLEGVPGLWTSAPLRPCPPLEYLSRLPPLFPVSSLKFPSNSCE